MIPYDVYGIRSRKPCGNIFAPPRPPPPRDLSGDIFFCSAMAWAEFSDWLRRTVGRNVEGVQFEFDTRQWSSSIRKWSTRAVEMDVQAKAVSGSR